MKDRVSLQWIAAGEWAVTVCSGMAGQDEGNRAEADFLIVAKSRDRAEAILRDLGRVLCAERPAKPKPRFPFRMEAEAGVHLVEGPF